MKSAKGKMQIEKYKELDVKYEKEKFDFTAIVHIRFCNLHFSLCLIHFTLSTLHYPFCLIH